MIYSSHDIVSRLYGHIVKPRRDFNDVREIFALEKRRSTSQKTHPGKGPLNDKTVLDNIIAFAQGGVSDSTTLITFSDTAGPSKGIPRSYVALTPIENVVEEIVKRGKKITLNTPNKEDDDFISLAIFAPETDVYIVVRKNITANDFPLAAPAL